MNFHPTTQKSKNLTSMGYFSLKCLRFVLKKYRGVIFRVTGQGCKKRPEELGELSLEHSKSEKLYIDVIFLSKAYIVSARKFQRNYV